MIKTLLSPFLVLFLLTFLVACTKQVVVQEKLASEMKKRNSVAKSSEPCPYECDDPRCVNYAQPCSGGGSGTGGSTSGASRVCGTEFQYLKLSGLTYGAAVDSIGKWHNDCQINLLAKMKLRNISLTTDTIQSFLKNTTTAFLAAKGITKQNTTLPNYDLSDSVWHTSGYSLNAQNILNQLKNLVNQYDVSQHTIFISQCNNLKVSALNLTDNKEALSVGVSVSIAINSFNYWKDNVLAWQNYLAPSTAVAKAACSINLKQLGGADISGAVSGAYGGGIAGGPAGVVAGGLLVGAGASSLNILGQAVQCMPGAVGSISRWLADWF